MGRRHSEAPSARKFIDLIVIASRCRFGHPKGCSVEQSIRGPAPR
jgi:hypothetical protein